jgi:hypothetical protein
MQEQGHMPKGRDVSRLHNKNCCSRQRLIVLGIQGLPTLDRYRVSQIANYLRTIIPHTSSLLEIRDWFGFSHPLKLLTND